MDFSVLTEASSPIPTHVYAAVLALLIGGIQFFLKKGGQRHRMMGYVWVVLMAYVALSSFFIHDLRLIGPFSPIHLLSILVLVSLYRGVQAARAGNVSLHRRTMRALYFYALIITGLFTFLPGRIMYQVVFG
ncbi:MAG: DUF2306 domain-containing protein [Pseudomonadota bacterium]